MTFGTVALDAAKAVLPFVGTALTGLVAKGWQAAITWEKNLKVTQNAQANTLIQQGLEWATNQAHTAIENAVNAVNQTITNPAKANGTWSATTAVQALQSALAQAEQSLSAQAKSILTTNIAADLTPYLTSLIEAFVPQAPTKTSAPTPATPAS